MVLIFSCSRQSQPWFVRYFCANETTKVLNGIACGLKSAARCLAEVTVAYCCIFGVSESSLGMKIGMIEQNQLRCSWISPGCWAFFSLAWLLLIAITQFGKVDEGFCLCRRLAKELWCLRFGAYQNQSSNPLCIWFTVCCVDLRAYMCRCTCNDFAMCIAVYRWVMKTNTK